MLTLAMRLSLRRMLLRLMCLVFVLVTAPFVLHAQEAPSPGAPPVSTAPDTEEPKDAPMETLKVNVNLVSHYFTVRDKHNGLIPNLTQDDCTSSKTRPRRRSRTGPRKPTSR